MRKKNNLCAKKENKTLPRRHNCESKKNKGCEKIMFGLKKKQGISKEVLKEETSEEDIKEDTEVEEKLREIYTTENLCLLDMDAVYDNAGDNESLTSLLTEKIVKIEQMGFDFCGQITIENFSDLLVFNSNDLKRKKV